MVMLCARIVETFCERVTRSGRIGGECAQNARGGVCGGVWRERMPARDWAVGSRGGGFGARGGGGWRSHVEPSRAIKRCLAGPSCPVFPDSARCEMPP